MKSPEWRIECNAAIFDKIKSSETFHQILALARAINGLQFVIYAMVMDAQDHSPAARRSRINSFLFGSAILYEGLLLVEKMNKHFGRDAVFYQGLHALLRDPVARTLRKSNMGPARNLAVFHYDPEEFGRTVSSASVHECEFMTGRGNSSPESYFPFADTLAAEVLMGEANADEDFYKRLGLVMSQTRDLSIRFTKFSERLISKDLHEWGFIHKTSALP